VDEGEMRFLWHSDGFRFFGDEMSSSRRGVDEGRKASRRVAGTPNQKIKPVGMGGGYGGKGLFVRHAAIQHI
jgi:hypothetical protein